jgi:hypothetical protein
MTNDKAGMSKESLVVEFYGIPRQRAGRTTLTVAAGSLAEVLTAVEQHCPSLQDLRGPKGAVSPHYRISLDGQRFVTEPDEILPADSHLLILSADAGG